MKVKNIDKTLIVLDLDETLIHGKEEALGRAADFKVFGYHIYKRPFLREFLERLQKDFLLAIWSSASDEYVEAISERLIDQTINWQFVWGRSKCLYKRNRQIDGNGYFHTDYENHYHYIKPLKKVKKLGFHLNRILIIDDSPHKCQLNFGNAIYPKAFKGEIEDDELKYLIEYLKIFVDRPTVRNVEKRGWRC